MKRILMALMLLPLIASLALSAPTADEAKLQQLAEKYEAQWAKWRGPEFQAAKAMRSGFYGDINADPNRELMGIDEQGNPIIYYTDNLNAQITTRVDEVQPGGISGYDLDGSTTSGLYHWDNSAANPNHQEFVGRVVVLDGGGTNEWHGNHTAGTMVAAGVSSSAEGMAPGAILFSNDWNNDNTEMANAGSNGAKVSSHSYHSGGGQGGYEWRAEQYDEVANASPNYTICIAAGNDGDVYGYNSIPSSNTAKNAIIVGAVNDVPNYTGPNSVVLANFSSMGPTDDDRIKPDIVGNGVNLYSTTPTSYTNMSGTSMSTPNVAGSTFLLYEQYEATHGGETPLSSTIKAIIIHTADECGDYTGPDYEYGWGLMNAHAACDLISYDADTDDATITEQYLIENQEVEVVLNVTGDEPVRATIVWNDPAANAGAATTLVNDLDIRIEELNSGSIYQPWVLNGMTNSPAFPGDNTQDNVEQILIQNPDPGTYVLTVSHKAQLQGVDQLFSLVVTGATSGEIPLATLNLEPLENFILPGGGDLTYTVDFAYNGEDVVSGASYWVDMILPNGNEWGPLFRRNFTITPGMQSSLTLSHNIPAQAPAGDYTVIGKVGLFPNVVGVSDSFPMTKMGTEPPASADWPTGSEVAAGETADVQLPAEYALSEAYPNPFNPSTSFSLTLPEASEVTVEVYNVSGQLVRTVAQGRYQAGEHEFSFNARDLAAGVYFLHATVPGELNAVRKLALVK